MLFCIYYHLLSWLDEFEQVIGTATEYGATLKDQRKSAFVCHFFGEDGSKKLSFKEFKALLQVNHPRSPKFDSLGLILVSKQ